MSVLPTQRTPPTQRLEDSMLLLLGGPKIGKTKLAGGFERGLFLATERGQGAVNAYVVSIENWEKLLSVGAELAAGNHSFGPLILDTVDLAFVLCQDYIRRKYNVAYEGDLSYGKGFTLVQDEFRRVILKLSHLGLGLVLIGHCEYETVEGRTGSYQRAVPQLKDKARRFICGLADLILHCDIETAAGADGKPEPRRVIRTKPSLYWTAGDRTGILPETLPLDFAALAAAFEAAQRQLRPATPVPGNSTPSQGDAK